MKKQNHFILPENKTSPFIRSETFDLLYKETYLSTYRYIYGLTGGPPAEVEDLTAETYMRAWKGRRSYWGEPEAAIGWILKIARNLVIDSYRRSKKSAPINEDFPEEDVLPSPAYQQPEDQLIASEQQTFVLHLLNMLPAQQHEILVLRYLLNWKVQQISQHLDLPENTISVYIRRALEKIRTMWPVEKELLNK